MRYRSFSQDTPFIRFFISRTLPKQILELKKILNLDELILLGHEFLEKKAYLNQELSSLFPFKEKAEKERINQYITQNGSDDDKVYFMQMKLAIMIIRKFYNDDGAMKKEHITELLGKER